jgi:DNA-binding NarL/FixJ family response regulator
MSELIRVLIADDHQMFRDGLATVLQAGPGTELAGAASTGAEAVMLARRVQPDVVVMDLRMPGMSGVDAIRRIIADCPRAAVMALTMFDDDESVLAALRAGACGYLLKGADRDTIRRAVQACADGQAIFGADLAARLLGRLTAGLAQADR